MKALVLGATGATGKNLVSDLIKDDAFDEIHIFVRRHPGYENKKLTVHIVDFEKPNEWKDRVKGAVAFSCLGTTLKDAGSKAAQWKVDYDFQYNFASAANDNGVQTLVLVSAIGANPNSKLFYYKMKGKLEEAVKKLDFTTAIFFNPGMLDRKNTTRNNEVMTLKIIRFFNRFGLLQKQRPLSTEVLAQAMVEAAKTMPKGLHQIKVAEIIQLSEQSN